MTLDNLFNQLWFNRVMCGQRLHRRGVTHNRMQVYDYDAYAWDCWNYWRQGKSKHNQ
jgi:hypothetical protein